MPRHMLPLQGRILGLALVTALLSSCGEPMFDNAGSQHSVLEDREACAREIDQTPAALVCRQNPTAYPEYVNQVFTDLNQCIDRMGGSKYGLSKN